MKVLSAIVVALVAGGLGLLLGGLLGSACVKWYRISGFEGGAGYFMVSFALIGALLGILIGVAASSALSAGFPAKLGIACGVVAALAAIAAFLCWLFADIPPTVDGHGLTIEVEVRLPPGTPDPRTLDPEQCTVELVSVSSARGRRGYGAAPLHLDHARNEDGRWIVGAEVYFWTTSGRLAFIVDVDGLPTRGFDLPAAGRPKVTDWSDWLPRRPAADATTFRYRVTENIPPPPGPSEEEIAEARFAEMKEEQPLQDWLRWLDYNAPDERNAAVMAVIERRQDELVPVLDGTDDALRSRALAAVARLRAPGPAMAAAVLREDARIEAEIAAFNALPPDDPRFVDRQIDLRGRFTDWKLAWWNLTQRDRSLDGAAPVRRIRDLAGVRSQGTSMSEIVVNAQAVLDGMGAK